MISVAIGMFFTELTGTPIAVIVQGVWWFIDINMGINKLEGAHTLFELTPRHNALGKMQTFLNELTTLAVNRLFIAGVALLLVITSVILIVIAIYIKRSLAKQLRFKCLLDGLLTKIIKYL